ncbi:EAL domain-containing protein [Halomonas huangheensis]|nr:EAL domain-containing protein [Halomonas huangheensis]
MSLLVSARYGVVLPVILVLLMVCNVLMALNTLLVSYVFEAWQLGVLILNRQEAYATLLVAAGILANCLQLRVALRMLAIAILLVALYQLAMCGWSWWQVTMASGCMSLPSTFLLGWFALCCWVGTASAGGRRYWECLGWAAMAAGLGLLVMLVIKAMLGSAWWPALVEIRVGGALWIFIHGIVLALVGQWQMDPPRLEGGSIRVAVIGLAVSLLIWFSVTMFYQSQLRDTALRHLIDVETAVKQWQRTWRARWSGMTVAGLLEADRLIDPNGDSDGLWHLNEIEALALLRGMNPLRNYPGLTADGAPRLQQLLNKPGVRNWLAAGQASSVAWHFMTEEGKVYAILAIMLDAEPDGRLLTLIDVQSWLQQVSGSVPSETTLYLLHEGRELARVGRAGVVEDHQVTALRRDSLVLADGTRLVLEARLMVGGLMSPGALLPLLLVFVGLFATYQLAIWVSLPRRRTRHAFVLEVREQQYRSLFSHSSAAVFHVLPDGTVREVNAVAEALLEEKVDDIAGMEFSALACRLLGWLSLSAELLHTWRTAISGGRGCCCRVAGRGSEARCYNVRMVPIVVDDSIVGVFAVFEDVSAWTETLVRLTIMERCLEESSNGVVILDATLPGNPVLYSNVAFREMTGYRSSQLTGKTLFLLAEGGTIVPELVRLHRAMAEHRPCSVTTQARCRNGDTFWCQISLSPVRDEDAVLTHYVAIIDDISLRRQHEQRLAYQATHDALTGLINRTMLAERLSHAIRQARCQPGILAVLFIDLDEFKSVNDSLGHEVGDRLLVSVARRLEQELRDSDSLARMGGDEFVLILAGLENGEAVERVALRLLGALERPHMMDGWQLHVTASIGIAELDSETAESPGLLMQRADIAMYRAKQKGRNQYQRFSEVFDEKLHRRLTLRNELRIAMDQHDLQLYYQPVINQSGHICGCEALLRWLHADLGWVSPEDFITIAEQTGQIVELGRWVLWRACNDAQCLVQSRLMPGRVAVNLSPLQFYRSDFLADLGSVLEEVGLDAHWLELELTEGTLMRDTRSSIDTLNSLAEMGITTAIDDFGKGCSSLDYLQRLPVTRIKLDKSFVHAIDHGDCNAAVCKSVIVLGRELELEVLAEGVETRAQYECLLGLGCEKFQGYLFARPMPFSALCKLLQDGPGKPLQPRL